MDGFDFTAEPAAEPVAPLEGFDFSAPAAPAEVAPAAGGFDFSAPAAPAEEPAAAGGFDFSAPAEEPAAAGGFDLGAPAEEPAAGGALDMMAGFQTEELPAAEEPAPEKTAFTLNSFNPKLAEIEEKTHKERQERQNAASLKKDEMQQEAAAALEKFHADRKAAAAAKLEANLAAEKEAAAALANETNPWNTVYGMIEGQHPSGASQKYNDVLLSLKENGKGSS